MFNPTLIEKFEEFKKVAGEYSDLDLNDVKFDKKKLHEIATITMGQSPESSSINSEEDGVPFYQGKTEFTDKYIGEPTKWTNKSKKNAKKDDILISMRAPAGAVNIATEKMSIGRGLAAITSNDDISDKYLFPYLKNMEDKINAEQDNGGFYSSMTKDDLYSFDIYIPKKINNNYDSEKIQQVIIKFLDYQKEQTSKLKEKMSSLQDKTSQTDKAVLSKIFEMEDSFIIEQFNKWAKLKSYDINGNNITFKTKRIHSNNPDEMVCIKRMGFTPKRDPEGDINWFKVGDLSAVDGLYINNPNTEEKTTVDLVKKKVDEKNTGKSEKLVPIKKGDILVSFLLTIGITKIYNSDKPAYCNQAIDILTCKDEYYNKYVAYNCIIEYPKFGEAQALGTNLNDDSKKEIKIMIPEPVDAYNSLEVQKILVEFIEAFYLWQNKILNLAATVQDKCNDVDTAFLNEIFKGSDDD